MSAAFRGAAPPTGPRAPVYDVIRLQTGEVYDLTILDELIYGVECHWVTDPETGKCRSALCLSWQGDCPHHGDRCVWCGYLAVLDHGARQRAILPLGEKTARALLRESGSYGGLRGLRLLFRRSSLRPRAELHWERSPIGPPHPLPQAHDLTGTLCMVFGVASLPDYRYSPEEIPGPPDAQEGGAS